jgi:hypothetical protein
LIPAVKPLFQISLVHGNVGMVGPPSARPPVGYAAAAGPLPPPPQSRCLAPVVCIRPRPTMPTVCVHPFWLPARNTTAPRTRHPSGPGYYPSLTTPAPPLQPLPHPLPCLPFTDTHPYLLSLACARHTPGSWVRHLSGRGYSLQVPTLAPTLLPPRAQLPLLPLAHRTATCAGVDAGLISSSRGSPCLVEPRACQARRPASLCRRFLPPPRVSPPLDSWVEGYIIPFFSPSRSLTNGNPLSWIVRNGVMTAGAGFLALSRPVFPLHTPASHRSGRQFSLALNSGKAILLTSPPPKFYPIYGLTLGPHRLLALPRPHPPPAPFVPYLCYSARFPLLSPGALPTFSFPLNPLAGHHLTTALSALTPARLCNWWPSLPH